jgi:5-methylcytosine-specific restriction endonuclease McrBC regulatory subunit McrC
MLNATTDNNGGNFQVPNEHCENLLAIGNYKIKDLCEQNPDLLIFPQSLGKYNDDIGKSHIFSLCDNNLETCNIMGFVGRNETQLTISSRFAQNDKHDYFLHYMLQKVFSINLFKFDQTPNKENIWDFLLYLFPYFLKRTYSQGLYKAYTREDYNDANVKGAIDVKRHIRINIPFAGKIAYTTREHSYDNAVTQLIRHTIEHIKTHMFGNGILTNDSETRDIVSKFCFVTQNSYNKNARPKIITANLKPVPHPYYTEYKMLQKICLRILRHEKLTYGQEKDKIYGLLFDGAWLWEEYLDTILEEIGFKHSKNKESSGSIQLFSDSRHYPRYPDFYKESIVLDAKYKPLKHNEAIDRNDIHQIISYMYVQQAMLSGFIYPEKEESQKNIFEIGTLRGYGNSVKLWNIAIPHSKTEFKDFTNTIKENERKLIENFKNEETKKSDRLTIKA